MSDDLYTKSGKPLQFDKGTVYSKSGAVVGRIHDERVFGPDGRYVGSLVKDQVVLRLIYRSQDSHGIKPHFIAPKRAPILKINRTASALWGDEPDIPA